MQDLWGAIHGGIDDKNKTATNNNVHNESQVNRQCTKQSVLNKCVPS